MPKIKDFFALLKTNGRINNPKFDELIEKAPDFEVSDEAVQAFDNSFYTLDRALTNPNVKSKIRFESLNPIDRDFEKIISAIELVDKESASRLKSLLRDGTEKLPDTYKRTEYLANSLSEIFNKVKAAPNGDDELKKQLEEKTKFIEGLTDKFTNVEKEYKTALSQKDKEYEEKLHDFQLDNHLERLAGTFTLAEAYEKTRPAINKVILSELKGSNKLRLGTKDGQTNINVLDDKGEPRFNGNSPILIQNLLEEKYQPFLKQSAEPPKTNTKTYTVTEPNPAVRRGAPTTVHVKK
jgi:hypothetical protein